LQPWAGTLSPREQAERRPGSRRRPSPAPRARAGLACTALLLSGPGTESKARIRWVDMLAAGPPGDGPGGFTVPAITHATGTGCRRAPGSPGPARWCPAAGSTRTRRPGTGLLPPCWRQRGTASPTAGERAPSGSSAAAPGHRETGRTTRRAQAPQRTVARLSGLHGPAARCRQTRRSPLVPPQMCLRTGCGSGQRQNISPAIRCFDLQVGLCKRKHSVP
jgi:hypothetical protein